jgi:hypothetical protein
VSVELRALRWAIIAAQHKSIRRAAETLNIQQSTLSRGLCDLGHRLGAIPFKRTVARDRRLQVRNSFSGVERSRVISRPKSVRSILSSGIPISLRSIGRLRIRISGYTNPPSNFRFRSGGGFASIEVNVCFRVLIPESGLADFGHETLLVVSSSHGPVRLSKPAPRSNVRREDTGSAPPAVPPQPPSDRWPGPNSAAGIAHQVLGVVGNLKLSQTENPVCF